MNRRDVYDDPRWGPLRERILARDRRRCTLGWLAGGPCDDSLHVHHIEPVEERPELAFAEENLVTACGRHHPMLEALRRAIVSRRAPRRCGHVHRTRFGREACERSLNAV